MADQTLIYGDERIPYSINPDPKRSTRVAIHVDPDGSVIVDAPVDHTADAIAMAVQKRARWIVNHVSEARDRYRHVRPKEYVSGEQILYLGRRYMLKVIPVSDAPRAVKLKGNKLMVETRIGTKDDIKGRVRGWYRIKARDYFASRIDELSHRLSWIEASPPFQLQEMTRQWGSCSPNGKVILNPHLVKAPRECITYVIVHELAHLKHHDHGPAFSALVNQNVPDLKKHKQLLDGMVELLVAD